jgi:hypothetical protein
MTIKPLRGSSRNGEIMKAWVVLVLEGPRSLLPSISFPGMPPHFEDFPLVPSLHDVPLVILNKHMLNYLEDEIC